MGNTWGDERNPPPRQRFTRGDIVGLIFIGLCAAYFAAHIIYAGLNQ